MNRTLSLVFFCVLIGKLSAQSSDSLALKNQKQINELRSRITAVENAELQFKLKHLQDSIVVLNDIISKLRGNQVGQKSSKECVRLYYEPSKTELNYANYKELDSLAGICLNNPKKKIKVIGYADKSGTTITNMRVSRERAVSIKNYLITTMKISASTVQTEWHGSNAALDETDSEKQNFNRRVEIYIVEPK